MRKYLFLRAADLICKGLIRPAGESPKAYYFTGKNEKGKEFNVEIFYEYRDGTNSILRWKCDCHYMGVQGISNGGVCSHVLAAFTYIILGKFVETFRFLVNKWKKK